MVIPRSQEILAFAQHSKSCCLFLSRAFTSLNVCTDMSELMHAGNCARCWGSAHFISSADLTQP